MLKNIFTPYDIRGRVPEDLNEDVAYRIGVSFANEISPIGGIAVGRDIRLSSPELSDAVVKGLNDAGVDTYDIGLCGTEVVYFASTLPGCGGGIMITASHNPKEYNGMKIVKKDAVPVSFDTGLTKIEQRIIQGNLGLSAKKGKNIPVNITEDYITKILSIVDKSHLKTFRILANCGNGCAGLILKHLKPKLPVEVVSILEQPDGNFPHGVPNPLLPENRERTTEAILKTKADFGVAWDGDNDRCFFFDGLGRFIEGYYIVGLFAGLMLEKNQGQKIIYDPRLIWNTIDIVKKAGGIPLQNKTGHAFFKHRMRLENAIYGGEMSAHHYFKQFQYCDSGMIPMLLMIELLSTKNSSLAKLVSDRISFFPCSGEINTEVKDPDNALEKTYNHFKPSATSIDLMDGLSMEFLPSKNIGWRFNLRKSNTEPLVRLNVEAKQDKGLVEEKTKEILQILSS